MKPACLSPWAWLLLAAAMVIALTAGAFFLSPARPAAAQNGGVCDRTQTVAARLVQRAGVNNCGEVTAAHLAAITQLNLSNQNLTTLRAGDFSGLSGLLVLRVNDNQLTELPPLDDLTALRQFYGTNNRLTELPDIPHSAPLQVLLLNGNEFTGALPSVSAYPNLTHLYVQNNQLTGLPDLSANTRLVQLFAQNNQLEALPSLSANTRLQQLGAFNNRLTELPSVSANTALTHLFAHNNDLTELPSLTANTALQQLVASGNRLTALPSLSANTALILLYVFDNELTALPSLTANTALVHLRAQDNRLTALPDLSANASLQILWAHNNRLTALPSLSANTALTQVAAFNNQLTSLPDLSANTALKYLNVHGNRLTALPNLRQNTALEELTAESNRLSAAPDLSRNTALITLELHDNRLTSLPNLSANTALKRVWVGWNSVSSLPSGFLTGLPAGLTHLHVEGVTLTSSELATIRTRFTALQWLYAGGTGLSATQADALLDNLPATLTLLGLSGNDLDGMTWSKLSRLTALVVLDATGANLDDADASAIAAAAPAGLQGLRMGYNGLTAIPSLSRLTQLASLHLYHNNLDEADLTATAFNGPAPSALTALLTAGNPGIASSDDALASRYSGVNFQTVARETSLRVEKAITGTPDNPGHRYGFALSCRKTGDTASAPRIHHFSVPAGESAYVPVHAPGLLVAGVSDRAFRVVGSAACTLAETDNGGAVATEGLFTDSVVTGDGREATVTNFFSVAPLDEWTPTLTLRDFGDGTLGCHDGVRGAECDAALDLENPHYRADRFSYTRNIYREPHTIRYEVLELYLTRQGELVLTMNWQMLGLSLVVDGKAFPAAAGGAGGGRHARWRNAGLQWTANQEVTLRMERPRATLDTLDVCWNGDLAGCLPARLRPYGYRITVPHSAAHVQVAPYVEHAGSTVKVGRSGSLSAVANGARSDLMALSPPDTVFEVEVTEGSSVNKYRLIVSNAAAPAPPAQQPTPACRSATVLTHEHELTQGSSEFFAEHTHSKQERHGRCRFQVIIGGKVIDSVWHTHPELE